MTTLTTEPRSIEPATAQHAAPIDRLLKIGDVAKLWAVGERTIERAIAAGGIPAPIRLGDARLWRREDVEGLLSIEDLTAWLNVSKSTINRLVEAGEFPRPIEISTRVRRWRKSEVESHLEQLATNQSKRRGSR